MTCLGECPLQFNYLESLIIIFKFDKEITIQNALLDLLHTTFS